MVTSEDKVNGNKLFWWTFSYHLGFIAWTFFSFKKKHCFDLCILIRTTCGKVCFYRSELIKTRTRRGDNVFLFASETQCLFAKNRTTYSVNSSTAAGKAILKLKVIKKTKRRVLFHQVQGCITAGICSDFECFVGSSDPLRMWFLSNKHN